ncbi:MAG: siphovirus Gp157 family protein [Clostridiales bacterium]|nr:siphovirus Gp157 family protein [Clostridiales bacterium]
MATLFEIVDDMQELYEMATDPEVDPEVFQDTLEGLKGMLEVKACGYVNVIKQLDMEAKQAKEVAQMFTDKAKVRENNIKRMKDVLKMAMDSTEQKTMAAGAFTIKLQKNGGLQPLVIDGEVPQNMTKVIVEPDGNKIREFLKDNTCEWAHLEPRGEHIVIK